MGRVNGYRVVIVSKDDPGRIKVFFTSNPHFVTFIAAIIIIGGPNGIRTRVLALRASYEEIL
jgi:hypothetical protein